MKRTLLFLVSVIFLVGSAEIGSRYWLGLGTPPLSVAHPSIEYMFAPNQDLYRFGNHQLYNEYGMRSISTDQITQPHRVIAFGDSVLNGGNLSDHSALATTLASDSETFYGNVSAGSWGPANMVAWIDEYGLLDAEVAIILISSHDLHDAPNFAPLNPNTHPTERPMSALVEGIERYAPRYLPRIRQSTETENASPTPTETSTARSIYDFIDRMEIAGIRLCAIQHKEKKELDSPPTSDSQDIYDIFIDRGVPVLDFGTALRESRKNPYTDNIHINDYGQELLAIYLRECFEVALLPK